MVDPVNWVVPWVPGALIATLAADEDYMATCGGRLSSRAQRDVSRPFSTVQVITSPPIASRAAAWRPVLQFIGWCPPGDPAGDDPALVAWRMAAAGIRAVTRAPKWSYQGWHGVWDIVLGPVEDVDTSRGSDAPIYGARVHLDTAAHLD